MLSLPPSVRILLFCESVDLRKGFDGLAALVRVGGEDPFSGHLFAFVSRRRDRLKILWFDHGGFVMWYQRLEQGRFQIPRPDPGQSRIRLEAAQLAMLLSGWQVAQRRPRRWIPPSHRSGE